MTWAERELLLNLAKLFLLFRQPINGPYLDMLIRQVEEEAGKEDSDAEVSRG